MAAAYCSTHMNAQVSIFSRDRLPALLTREAYTILTRKSFVQKTKVSMIKATVAQSSAPNPTPTQGSSEAKNSNFVQQKKKLRILVAGGGIGGLVFALAAKKKEFEVVVFEKDLSAIRGEGKYRGPIQIQSNALAALEAIDAEVAQEVLSAGCVTGDRVNGLVDGISGTWFIKFNSFTPAVERGLPVTRVISRMTLQEILARAVGEDVIMNSSNVVDFGDDGNKVTVVLENGQIYHGDVLVGADGIWSKVREKLFGPQEAVYSGYTCYTGIADFVPADIESIGYRVYLGHKQYFVSSDVGAGKMQWYAFHKERPGGVDGPEGKKARLLSIFKSWRDNMIDLIQATDEDSILRRDIYDRSPNFNWGKDRVTLLGDSIHAMQPNMGQGGCMAIEDSFQLASELDKSWRQSIEEGTPVDIVSSLKRYERSRRLRVAIIHGMSRMLAMMASSYKAYLGVGLGPLSFLTKFRIPHPGRVAGMILVSRIMPLMLSWVLGGYSSNLEGRPLCCHLSDKANDQLQRWLEDDDALERAINGEWFLLPFGDEASSSKPISSGMRNIPASLALLVCDQQLNLYNTSGHGHWRVTHPKFSGLSVSIPSNQLSSQHALVSYKEGTFFLTDLQSELGTWITNNEGRRYQVPANIPVRFRPSDIIEFGSSKKVAFRVKVVRNPTNFREKE